MRPTHADTPALDIYDNVWGSIRHWVETAPDLPAIDQEGTVWSYGQLGQAVDRLTYFLGAHDVAAGDRVLFVMENSIGAIAGMLAAMRLGAWAIPLNARLSVREIDEIRKHAGPRLTLYTTDVSKDALAHAERHGAREAPSLKEAGLLYAPADTVAHRMPAFGPPRDRVAALIYTSGTTGNPKGVMLTHGNLLFIAGRSSQARLTTPADKVYAVLPISHVFGLASVFLGNMYRGAQLKLVSRFAPAEAARSLAEDGITTFHGVPAMFSHLVSLAASTGQPVRAPKLRYMSVGGAPLDLSLKQRVESMFGIPLNNGYGLTENAPTVCMTMIGKERDDDSVGTLLDGVEVRMVDPASGKDVPTGGVGEMWVKGGLVMKGYFRDPVRTAEVLTPDHWLKTGDLARMEEDGSLYIVGRLKELIIRSGFNVYPSEVEGVITSHPDVAMAVVVGRSRDGNEEVVAFVQPIPGRSVTAEALDAFVSDRLAPYKHPSQYLIRDTLPATPTGKILRHQLQQEATGL